MTAKELELIKAYQEYIHFLSKAYDDALYWRGFTDIDAVSRR